jgi:hypothetical protein
MIPFVVSLSNHIKPFDKLMANGFVINLYCVCYTITPDMQAHLATGHNSVVKLVANLVLPTLPGAGALRSTAQDLQDLLKFLAANLGLRKSTLLTTMQKTH